MKNEIDIFSLQKILLGFLRTHYVSHQPVLLALSGGADSLALFHLLLKCQAAFSPPIKLGIAHVDHGWRAESGFEAQQLKELVLSHGLPFHLKKLDPYSIKGNLEEGCRLERFSFFSELCEQFNYQAVILGHHSNDQAETVLKRVLEGAPLTKLGGMSPESTLYGVKVWRPWLTVSKKSILTWLESQNLIPFEDQTNHDPRFLRAKFRTQIIPNLSHDFGKEIESSLLQMAVESEELKNYLDNQVKDYWKSRQLGLWGSCLDLKGNSSLIEVKYLLRKLCLNEKFSLSRDSLERAARLVISGVSDRKIEIGAKKIYIDRHKIFLPTRELIPFSSHKPLNIGSFSLEDWSISVQKISKKDQELLSGWKAAWAGRLSALVPLGDYSIGVAKMKAPYHEISSISKWWTHHKVPAFLRSIVPVLWKGDQIFTEFLTGNIKRFECQEFLFIELCLLTKCLDPSIKKI